MSPRDLPNYLLANLPFRFAPEDFLKNWQVNISFKSYLRFEGMTGAALEEEGLEDSRPAAAAPTAEADEFSLSEDEMDDFIDDDDGDGSKRRARYKARGAPQGVSSHGIQVASWCTHPKAFLSFAAQQSMEWQALSWAQYILKDVLFVKSQPHTCNTAWRDSGIQAEQVLRNG